jgi:hypothetical protein
MGEPLGSSGVKIASYIKTTGFSVKTEHRWVLPNHLLTDANRLLDL